MTHIGRVWRGMAAEFEQAGLGGGALDARLLVGHVLGLDATGMIARENEPILPEHLVRISELKARRLAGEPVARILGTQEFYGLSFELGSETLVPRPETELLVDLALEHLKGIDRPVLLDLGTGTGCIPIAILAEVAEARGIAVDLSVAALDVARRNAQRHSVSQRLELKKGSWFAPLPEDLRFDLITANPPYIPSGEIEGLQREVRLFDPVLALSGGADGLEAYRAIIGQTPQFLRPEGALMMEIGFDQREEVTLMCRQSGLNSVRCHADLAGHDRVIVARH